MTNSKKKKVNKYRISIFDDAGLRELRTFKITKFSLFSYIGGIFVLLSVIIGLLFVFTPLNFLVPAKNYTDSHEKIIKNAQVIDSLKKKLLAQDHYVYTIKSILQGKVPNDTFTRDNSGEKITDSTSAAFQYDFNSSDLDSILRLQIEEAENQNLPVIDNENSAVNLKNLHFTVPLRGLITGKFEPERDHYGVDIVAGSDDAAIVAILPGTVINDSWSIETGHVIQLQHDYDLISTYKHNSVLLKKTGDRVEAGESIAIVGNSGEHTTGPHLHFELWHNGEAVNPINYITF